MFSCEFCEIVKNSFYYRTTPVAASASSRFLSYQKNLKDDRGGGFLTPHIIHDRLKFRIKVYKPIKEEIFIWQLLCIKKNIRKHENITQKHRKKQYHEVFKIKNARYQRVHHHTDIFHSSEQTTWCKHLVNTWAICKTVKRGV